MPTQKIRNTDSGGHDLQRIERNALPKIEHDFLHVDGQDRENLKRWFDYLQGKLDDPENYIDHGGAAVVFSVNETICIKMVTDRHNAQNSSLFNLGNNACVEARIQEKLSSFETAGVRSPKLIMYIQGEKYHGIIMEKLNATNLNKCLQKEVPFPEKFNPQEFYFDLDEYLYALHDEKDLGHGDLYARNIMIDNATGKPIIIDFGRSEYAKKSSKQDDRIRLDEIGKSLCLTI